MTEQREEYCIRFSTRPGEPDLYKRYKDSRYFENLTVEHWEIGFYATDTHRWRVMADDYHVIIDLEMCHCPCEVHDACINYDRMRAVLPNVDDFYSIQQERRDIEDYGFNMYDPDEICPPSPDYGS